MDTFLNFSYDISLISGFFFFYFCDVSRAISRKREYPEKGMF